MKKPGMFDILPQVLTKKTTYDYDKKIAPAYMLSMYLSHDNSLLPTVNNMNMFQFNIPDEIIYKYYFNTIPKRRFIKWVKKAKEDKENQKLLEALMNEDPTISSIEAKKLIQHLKKVI